MVPPIPPGCIEYDFGSGGFILVFLIHSFLGFRVVSWNQYKIIQGDMSGLLADGKVIVITRRTLPIKICPIWRCPYWPWLCFSFVHLLHGFNSAFSIGLVPINKYTKGLKGFGKALCVLIPLGFYFHCTISPFLTINNNNFLCLYWIQVPKGPFKGIKMDDL